MKSKLFLGGIIGAMEHWQSSAELESILGGMIKGQHAKEEAMKTRLPVMSDHECISQLMVDYPWMVQYIDAQDFHHEKPVAAKPCTGHGHAAGGQDMDDAHADIDFDQNIFDILARKRMELHMANPGINPGQAFIVQLQGGA